MSLILYYIFLQSLVVFASKTNNTLSANILSIQQRLCFDDKLISNFKKLSLAVTFVEEFSDVTLQCRRCNETFTFSKTIHWYKTIREQDETYEEKLESPLFKFSEVGSVLIENVTYLDAGIYSCRIGNGTKVGYDLKVFNPITYKNMTLARVNMYVNETVLVVNEVLRALKSIKTVVSYHITEWTRCFCKSGEKKMNSYHLCYVRIQPNNITNEMFIYQCQSEELSKDFHDIFEKVMPLKDFRAQKLCYECLPLYHKSHKDLRFKGLIHKSVVSGMSLQVPCMTKKGGFDNEIRWVKDNSIYFDANFNALGIGPVERHIGVDTVGELLISKVVKEDKGTYACFINGEPILKLVLKILPQDVRDTAEFKEGLIQLTFLFVACFLMWIPYGIYIYRKKVLN